MNKLSNTIVRTNDVIGKKVIDADKNECGTVEEIVLDKLSGQVRYAVLSLGGFLGIGDSLHALPWKALNYCTEHDSFEINLDKEKLKASPGFNKKHWPDFADETWGNTISNYYGF